MNLVNKCFKVIEEDEELLMQFPEFKLDTEFKVITTDTGNGNPDGITSVQIKGGDYIHVNSRDSWFWCFYCQDTLRQIEEVEELASDVFPAVPMNLYEGHEITECLENIADELNNYNGSLVLHAAAYIKQLEAQLKFSDKAF